MPRRAATESDDRTRPRSAGQPWHARTADAVLAALDGDAVQGLSRSEAERRLARHGPNRLPTPARRGPLQRLLAQFRNLLIYVLLGAAGVTALLGHWIDTGVILGVVLINAVIGFLQEGKAENALAAISAMLSPQATVTRDGRRQTLPAEALVPGDLVHLASGDKVPADLRLIRVRSLQAQEAALTGESVPVDKSIDPVAADAGLGDRAGIAHSGTLVVSGRGTGVVVATGADTEIGRISGMLARVETLTTPLLAQMQVFGRWLTAGILALAAAAFGFGVLLRGYGADEMFLAAVGLAVAAIPEGLPAIMTITLAIGVSTMAQRNAIIRRLPAVETLGAVTTICSDKTGTLTRNEMSVRCVVTAAGRYDIADPAGGPRAAPIRRDGRPVDPAGHADLLAAVQAGVRCNEAELTPASGPDDPEHVSGNPVDVGLLRLGLAAGRTQAAEADTAPRLDAIPFESAHKFMASLHRDPASGARTAVLKGAPERVIALCDRVRGAEGDAPLEAAAWRDRAHRLAEDGLRVLAVAERAQPAGTEALGFADLDSGGFTLLGLFGLLDPPRPEAQAAIADCRSAGIRVKMITGDHAATAGAVARDLGLAAGDGSLTGPDLEALDDAELTARVREVDVYARTTPEHKLRLVSALQSHGEVVAMTGDGVNDAPALKRADVGIAMGRRGTEAAKEAAEMVLADDNFASIARAVHAGRVVYDNLKKAIVFILPTNGGEAFTLLAAIGFGTLLPITPVQILWVNMVTAVTLALALAFEGAEAGVMARPPRRRSEPILSPFLVWRIGFVSLLLVIAVFGSFWLARQHGADLATARTLAVNMLVAGEIAYLFNARRLYGPALGPRALAGARPALLSAGLVIAFQLLFTYWGAMQLLFDTAPLALADWARIVAAALALFLLVEAEKWALRRWAAHRRG